MITLDEAIAKGKEEAKRLRKIIETGYDGEISIEAIFCDDTDAIKEAYKRFENCAKKHEQYAEWLEELKELRANSCCVLQFARILKDICCVTDEDYDKAVISPKFLNDTIDILIMDFPY